MSCLQASRQHGLPHSGDPGRSADSLEPEEQLGGGACSVKTEIDLKLSSDQQFPFLVAPRDPRASQLLDDYLPGSWHITKAKRPQASWLGVFASPY